MKSNIQVEHTTRERLRDASIRKETYDETINRALNTLEEWEAARSDMKMSEVEESLEEMRLSGDSDEVSTDVEGFDVYVDVVDIGDEYEIHTPVLRASRELEDRKGDFMSISTRLGAALDPQAIGLTQNDLDEAVARGEIATSARFFGMDYDAFVTAFKDMPEDTKIPLTFKKIDGVPPIDNVSLDVKGIKKMVNATPQEVVKDMLELGTDESYRINAKIEAAVREHIDYVKEQWKSQSEVWVKENEEARKARDEAKE
jgi:hypothetical protein